MCLIRMLLSFRRELETFLRGTNQHLPEFLCFWRLVIAVTDPWQQRVLYQRCLLILRDSGRSKETMAKRKTYTEMAAADVPISVLEKLPLWQLDIVELTGHNLEARGREEVNRLLETGWRLLHIYTLKYAEDGVWRERPMGILGRLRNGQQQDHRGSRPPLRQSSEL